MSGIGEIPGSESIFPDGDPYRESMPPYYEALQAFDKARGEINAWIGEFSHNPYDNYETTLENNVQTAADALGDLVLAVLDAHEDDAEAQALILDVMKADDAHRVQYLNALSGKEDGLQPYEDDEITHIVADAFSDLDEPGVCASLLSEQYGRTVLIDFESAIEIMEADFDDNPSEQDIAMRQHLVDMLSGYAMMFDPDFADGYSDGTGPATTELERGGWLASETSFTATRIRGTEVSDKSPSGIIASESYEYVINTSLERLKLNINTVPAYLIKLAVDTLNYDEEDFQGIKSVSLRFDQQFTVHSENLEFNSNNLLSLVIDGDEVQLDNGDLDGLVEWMSNGGHNEDLFDDDEDSATLELAAVGSTEFEDELPDELAYIFDESELTAAQEEFARARGFDEDARIALSWMLEAMGSVRFLPRFRQYERAGKIVKLIFEDPEAADAA